MIFSSLLSTLGNLKDKIIIAIGSAISIVLGFLYLKKKSEANALKKELQEEKSIAKEKEIKQAVNTRIKTEKSLDIEQKISDNNEKEHKKKKDVETKNEKELESTIKKADENEEFTISD